MFFLSYWTCVESHLHSYICGFIFISKGESCPDTDIYYAGSGGSHAGFGGLGTGSKREDPFGAVFRPAVFGKAGYAGRSSSSCTSGFGGGSLNLTVSGTLQIDGEISSR